MKDHAGHKHKMTPQTHAVPEAAISEPDPEAPTMGAAADNAAPVVDWARALRSYVPTVKIAEGGFSEIWEALQVELGRIVAIKRLKARADKSGRPIPLAPRQVTMFRQEALVAAHLEHPNILPVYDLDFDADGLPFLVMKRVRGEPWSDVLQRDFDVMPVRALLRKHLPILAAVTRAVAFAHAEGLVHRDLKPGQVMIGPFGEVLLMDWGLAMAYPRRVHDPTAPEWLRDPNALLNRPINPAGTPSYMAPEQTEATTDRLGPWTDVYLLGAMLYRILTSQPPHWGADSSETFRLAQAGLVDPVEQVMPGREHPPELVALASRALEPDPERRMQSATEFLQALEDYMIGADKQRESTALATRARDSLSSQHAGYETFAEAINMLERAMVLWPDNREAEQARTAAIERYTRLALANRDLKLARLLAQRMPDSQARSLLLAQVHELEELEKQRDAELAAAHERVREERNRAEQLIAYLVGDLYVQLRRIGRLDTLAGLCGEALRYLQEVQMESETPAVVASRVRAYLNIADVYLERGQSEQAAQACNEALKLVEMELASATDPEQWCVFHAEIYRRLGAVVYHTGDYAAAKQAYEKGYEALKQVSAERLMEQHDKELALLLHGIGLVHWREGRTDLALSYQTEAETLTARLCRMAPANQDYVVQRAGILATLGNVYRDLGELDSAVSVTEEALRLHERLHRLDPGDFTRASGLLWVRNNLALLLLIRGEHDRAKRLFLASVEVARELAQNDPENLQHIRDLGFANSLAGEIAYMQHELSEARQLMGEALVVAREIAAREPQSLYARCGVARTHTQVGEVCLCLGETGAGLHHLREASARAEEVLAKSPANPTAIKAWTRAMLLRWLEGDPETTCREAELRRAAEYLTRLQAPSDELDRLDNEAALALLRGDFDTAIAVMGRLRQRGWLAPALLHYARRKGVVIADEPAPDEGI
jgi:serine/threonine protein kinase